VNLPMVIKLAGQTSSDSLIEMARRVCGSWTPGNLFAGDLLAPPEKAAANNDRAHPSD